MTSTLINYSPTYNRSIDKGTLFLLGVIGFCTLGFLFFVYGFPFVADRLTSVPTNGVEILPNRADLNVGQNR